MSKDKQINKPVVFVGMMGAGKTYVGRAFAKATGLPFYDSDQVIEDKAGMSIPEIFKNFGEKKFRESEHNTIVELVNGKPCVLSTGGGALMNSQTLEILKKKSTIVWIDADLDVLWERVQKSEDRPLLKTEDPKGTLKKLLNERKALYEQAHHHVKNNDGQADKVVENILELL